MQPLLDAMNAVGDDPAKQMTSRLLVKTGNLCRAEEELRVMGWPVTVPALNFILRVQTPMAGCRAGMESS